MEVNIETGMTTADKILYRVHGLGGVHCENKRRVYTSITMKIKKPLPMYLSCIDCARFVYIF